ncbi:MULTISPECIES: DNA-methyltransferase [Bacillus cereus group]|uniref:Methyltransferase n=2 Tax=Bacillaceae TaxID=186817 RepID=A0AAJ1NK57_9BACI|nr:MULTISPECIES: site-specific DNA-methyltransferase [Bacillus cereus group]AJG58166.1 DNA methylase family protein [Bacillus cereus D17]MCU5057107.1 site-specific DNA-methyltransferase [Bacillus cereus]MDE7550912.1 site-specific DNA-methyltransferase [Bacillus tropicus]MDE7572113.1 site-specific DNA-methyltransferase [Bacillus tropicus]MDG0950397.1 site-specific DNA-methyltransferase [Bacillus paranthracis]
MRIVDEMDYKLINGSCLNSLKDLPDNSVDLILTDPPYNLGNFMRERQTNLKRMRENSFYAAGWDDLEYEEWVEHMDTFFQEANRVLKKKGALIVFMSLIKMETIVSLATQYKLYYKTTGIWHKTNPMPRNMNLHFINSVEGWVYFVNESKTGTFNNEGKAIHDFIETSVTPLGEKKFGKHPTQKPQELFEHFVLKLTNPQDVVLDPFMGSGTAGVASLNLGRKFIGIEINEVYFDVSHKRLEQCCMENYNLFNTISKQRV